MTTTATRTRRQLIDSVRLATLAGTALLLTATAASAQHGIDLYWEDQAARLGFRPGFAVLVMSVNPGGSAAAAGIHPMDAITHVEGIRTSNTNDVLRYLSVTARVGRPAVLRVICPHTRSNSVISMHGMTATRPAPGGYGGYGSAGAGMTSAPSWGEITQRTIDAANRGMQLAVDCSKGVPGACKAADEQAEKNRRMADGHARTAGVIGGMAASAQIGNSVRKTEQTVRDSNAAANLRSLANDYDQMARDAARMGRGDLVAQYTAKAAELRRQAGK